jgi:hypothetical protein
MADVNTAVEKSLWGVFPVGASGHHRAEKPMLRGSWGVVCELHGRLIINNTTLCDQEDEIMLRAHPTSSVSVLYLNERQIVSEMNKNIQRWAEASLVRELFF